MLSISLDCISVLLKADISLFIPLWKALKEAREDDPRLTEADGICACYEIENMGFCRDGITRWYHFTSVDGEPAYTLKR